MRKFAHCIVGFVAAIAWSPANSAATWCTDSEPDPEHPLSWEKLGPRVMAEVVARRYEAGYRIVLAEFHRVHGEAASNIPEVDDFRVAFQEYLVSRDRAGDQPTRWRGEWDSIKDVQRYFFLAPNDSLVPVEIPCTEIRVDAEFTDTRTRPRSPKVSVAYAALALETAAGSDLGEARREATQQAQAVYDAHEQWLFNGLAQWPWELWLNGSHLSKDFTAPPRPLQWIALRPNATLVANFDSFQDSSLDHALTLEPFGFVRYVEGSNYRKWWGLSPILTLTSDHGAGYGVLGRYNNFVLGAAYHERDDRVLWYLSVDLYRYILGQQGRLRQLDQAKDGLARESLRKK